MGEFAPSVEVLRRAAMRRDAPPRLLRAADAVLEGKFSWEEVVEHTADHPVALMLDTPKARDTLWPLLQEVADELAAEQQPAPDPVPDEQEDYYSQATVLRDSFDVPDDRW